MHRLEFCLLAAALFWSARFALAAQNEGASAQRSISGVAKSGDVRLPGVTITALNSATGRQIVTSTDVDGSYLLLVPEPGTYTLSAQLTAFAPATQTDRKSVV